MKDYLNVVPYGFWDACFDGYDEDGILIKVNMDSEKFNLALYDSKGKNLYPIESHNKITFKAFSKMEDKVSQVYICVVYHVNGDTKAAYLRNVDLEIPSECMGEFYDKRTLYGDAIADKIQRVLIPYYQNDSLLAVELCNNESLVYFNQVKNEMLNVTVDVQSKNRVFIICKQVEGNYVGLINRVSEIEKIVEYSNSDEDKKNTYLSFLLDAQDYQEINNYDVVWTHHGKYYYAPLSKCEEKCFAILDYINVSNFDGIELQIFYDCKKYGKYCSAQLVQNATIWEKKKDFDLKAINCEYNEKQCIVTYRIDSKKMLSDLGIWSLQITTENNDTQYELCVKVEDEITVTEFFDEAGSKRKISFKCKDGCLYIQREYGHNAMFKKNLQNVEGNIVTLDDFLRCPGINTAGEMYGEYIEKKGCLNIRLYQNMADVQEAKLVMYHSQGRGVLVVQDIPVVDGCIDMFEVKLPDIDWDGKFEKPINNIWFRVAIAIRDNSGIYFAMLKDYDSTLKYSENGYIYDRRNLYFDALGENMVAGVNMTALPYYSDNYMLSMKYVRPNQIYRSQFTNELIDVKIKRDIMTIKIKCIDTTLDYKGVLMEYRHDKEDEAQSYLINYSSLVSNKDYLIMTVNVDMKKYYMRMLYWDIRCAFEIDGQLHTVSCHSNNDKFLNKYKNVFVDRTYPNNNSILFPYATDNHSVALMHRESCPQDGWAFRFKEKIAENIYKMFKRHWDKKKIYLIFEKYCVMAQDNGFFFFKYCMDANVEETFDGEIYYVIDPKQADWQKVVPYKKHVLKYLSLKHIIYLQACRLMISTDTKGHAYVWRSMGSRIKDLTYKKNLVFLQHGVTAFKRGHFERGTKVGCECFITTSQFEHDIIHNYLEYPEYEVPITGFSRWDVLHDKSEGHREILMMPTWRTWLDDAENEVFAESDYCKNYMALLNDPRLDAILKEYDVTLNFYLHPKFKKFISEFSVVSEHIRLIPFGEIPLNELMMECNLLITDFSSVAWDVYYMNKPVLFYHFDLEDTEQTLGFYMDMRNDLFGERAEKPEELMSLIIEYIENGFVMKEEYIKGREKYFAYVDDNNSERIWKAILEREF